MLWLTRNTLSGVVPSLEFPEATVFPLAINLVSSFAAIFTVGIDVHSDHRTEEVMEVPANAHVEQVASHSDVLERGRLLVSHAGHGSVMKALWHGRPMVLMPWGRDQPGVAARAQALGVAEVVQRGPNAEAELAHAIDRALASSEMQNAARAHSERLRRTDSPRIAASLLESLV